MCLIINESIKAPTKTVKLFKYYRLTESKEGMSYINTLSDANYQLGRDEGLLVTSPSWDRRQILRRDERLVSDRDGCALTADEAGFMPSVSKGIHCYTTKERALRQITDTNWDNFVVVQFEGKPQHFVGAGDKTNFGTHVVYTEVTPKRVVAIRFKDGKKTFTK